MYGSFGIFSIHFMIKQPMLLEQAKFELGMDN